MIDRRRLTRPFRAARARARSLPSRLRHHRELRQGAKLAARADRTPIFVLGAPRSGTTLLYQLLVEGLDVGWLANAHLRDPSDVCRIERAEQPRRSRSGSDWRSAHGRTNEPWGPNEAGEFWYRFVPRQPHQLDDVHATPRRVAAIRAAVRAFMDACDAPVVFKNVFNSLRVPVLAAALPEARFVLIERDEESNARSLLSGRVARGDATSWWSARPAGDEAVRDASPGAQVVWQVRRMNRVARRELAALHEDRWLAVGYDELCADPAALLERVHAWLVASGSQVAKRPGATVPAAFEQRTGGMLEPELEAQLAAALASAPGGEDAP